MNNKNREKCIYEGRYFGSRELGTDVRVISGGGVAMMQNGSRKVMPIRFFSVTSRTRRGRAFARESTSDMRCVPFPLTLTLSRKGRGKIVVCTGGFHGRAEIGSSTRAHSAILFRPLRERVGVRGKQPVGFAPNRPTSLRSIPFLDRQIPESRRPVRTLATNVRTARQ